MSAKKKNEPSRLPFDEALDGVEIPDVLNDAESIESVDDGLSGVPIVWEEELSVKESTYDESDLKRPATVGSDSLATLKKIDRFLSDNYDDVGIPLDFESILDELFRTFGEEYDRDDEGIPLTPEEEPEEVPISGYVVEDENDVEPEKGSISGHVLEDENDNDDEATVPEKEEDSNENVEETENAPSYLNEDDLLKLKELADSGDPKAMCRYARVCEEGTLAPRDSQRAFLYYREAAIRRYAPAQLAVGLCYRWGLGARADERKAFEWFKRSARNHNAEALYQLGLCFAVGLGVEPDWKFAARCFRQSARAGVVDAQIAYGVALLRGRGTVCNVAKGKRLLRYAARRGSVAAKRTLRAFLDELENAPKKDLSEQNPENKNFDFALDDLKFARNDRK